VVYQRDLQVADTGTDVQALQKQLNASGFTIATTGPGSPGNETTYFGPATKSALARYQASKGLPATGYFGAQTRALFGGTSSQMIAPTTGSFTRFLKIGMTGTDVQQLQVLLNTKGYQVSLTGPGSPGSETTYYGPATARAVSRFQEAYASEILTPSGLTSGTGYFGPSTMRRANAL
jgi:peptidoglycan hydrolase-like protein with peptidoglycan-binding domain